MTNRNDLSDNPFVGLFGSEDRVRLFHASFKRHDSDSEKCAIERATDEYGAASDHDDQGVDTLLGVAPGQVGGMEEGGGEWSEEMITGEINRVLEDIFLITLTHPGKEVNERNSKFIFLGDSPDVESDSSQNCLSLDDLERAVCDRLLCADVKSRLIGLESKGHSSSKTYEELDSIAYLAASFCRLKKLATLSSSADRSRSKSRGRLTDNRGFLTSEWGQGAIQKCHHTIISQSRLCFQNPELFPVCQPAQQFMRLLTDSMASQQEVEWMLEYFESISNDIEANKEEGTVFDAFRPVLDILKVNFLKVTIDGPELWTLADLVMFFTRNKQLARAFLDHIEPVKSVAAQQNVGGQLYESTLLGAMLSLSCLPKGSISATHFFNRPSRLSQTQVDNVEGFIQPIMERLADKIYTIIYAILKMGGDIRQSMLNWIGQCLHANQGRAKLWSHQMDAQLHQSLYCSDSFALNLCAVLLRLCRPFSARPPTESTLKLLRKIQPSYCVAAAGSLQQSNGRNVHMMELKETCLLPPVSSDAASDSATAAAATVETSSSSAAPVTHSETAAGSILENQFSFTTECFFMTHFALRIGFRALHDKFLKLNQDLHRMRGVYQDLLAQGSSSSGPSQQLQNDMDMVMSVYLCQKTALTEHTLIDLCFDFYVATATYLVDVVAKDSVTTENDITASVLVPAVPSESVVQRLTAVPELLVENVQDFMLFIKRFKDGAYESHGEDLAPLLSLILVYMGSPQYMRNPHLRAGMAEALEALLPPRASSQHQQDSLVTHYQREKLFSTHPHVSQISVALISVFVSIEMTGQGVQFEHKFKYRQPMYIALEYLWKLDEHRAVIKDLARYAELHAEDTEAPLFLRFINLLINDAIYLLDEALSSMSQIKEKQEARERGDWSRLDARQRQEAEGTYRHLSMLARFHNIMANETISALEMITREIHRVFTMSCMIDRIAAMLNYFLLHLVGPNKRNLRVQGHEEFEFRPRELVANITRIYLNLGGTVSDGTRDRGSSGTQSDSESFCRAVAQDTRSYSHDLFVNAETVLVKIGTSPGQISEWNELSLRIRDCGSAQALEDDLLADAPDDYLDPIMGTLMRDPVLLPSSGKIVDRATIARHILSDQFDPFNRQPLTMDMVQPADELRKEISDWLLQHKSRPDSVPSSSSVGVASPDADSDN